MSLTNPPKRGKRGLGQTAALGGRLREASADSSVRAQVARPAGMKGVIRREMEDVKAVVREEAAATRADVKADVPPGDRGGKV